MKRRKFIKKTAAGSLALYTMPTILTGNSWKGANDRVNIAQIGIHGMGQAHIREYHNLDNQLCLSRSTHNLYILYFFLQNI